MTTKAAARRKLLRQAFKAAKIYLARNGADIQSRKPADEEFICSSLDRAHLNGHISRETADLASDMIMERIWPSVTACRWIQQATGLSYSSMTEDDVQQWRHRWLDSLIWEFSK